MMAVYTLRDPRSPDVVRYVGSAWVQGGVESGLRMRLKAHLRDRDRHARRKVRPSLVWMRSLRARVPLIEPIGLTLGNREALALEAFWVRALLAQGHPLTNVVYAGTDYMKKAIRAAWARRREAARLRAKRRFSV